MAQLTDDCFAFAGPLMPIAEMERLIAERVQPVSETATVRLAAARGRVLAADIIAPLDLPPFDNSAVDGYAVRHADLAGPHPPRRRPGARATERVRVPREHRPGDHDGELPADGQGRTRAPAAGHAVSRTKAHQGPPFPERKRAGGRW